MRVALLFYGQARHVSNTPDYGSVVNTIYHEILSKYNTDVFGHVWWSGKNETYINSTWSKISKVPVELSDSILVLNSIFRPKLLVVEAPRIFKYNDEITQHHANTITNTSWWTTGTVNHSNVLSQLYSISQASKLVEKYSLENSVKYDAVVMTRYDSQIWDLPNLNTIDPNKLYTQRVDFDGKTFDESAKGDYAINPFILNSVVRIGYQSIGLFVDYSLLSYFKPNKTDNVHPLAFGVTLNF